MRLHVLGPVTVRDEGDPSTASMVSQPLQMGLLCYLALARPRGMHSREKVISLLWPEFEASRGRKALRNALHGLRRLLGEQVIVSVGDQLIGLNPELLSCDAHDLERGTWRMDTEVDIRDIEPLQGFHVRNVGEFDYWLSQEQARLRGLLERHAMNSSIAQSVGPPRVSPYASDAWLLHVRGHYLFLRAAHGGPVDELLRSREYFERSLLADPKFAPALAGLSNFHAVAARRGILAPFHEHFATAIQLSEQILALDPTVAVPHVHFGVKALYLDDDIERAEAEFRLAVSKDVTYAEGHRFLGIVCGLQGRPDEALRCMESAVALEPDIAHMLSSLALARLATGDVTGCESALRKVLLLEPRHRPARDRLVYVLDSQGRIDEALEVRERHPALQESAALREAYARGESHYRSAVNEVWLSEIEGLVERVLHPDESRADDLFSPPVLRVVQLYARVGDWKRARSWRLQGVAGRPGLAPWFDTLPELQGAVMR